MRHADVRGVTFVGSTPVARIVYRTCGELGKRVIAQGGAKNFLVVMPDADWIYRGLLMTSFYGCRQRCCPDQCDRCGKDAGFYKPVWLGFWKPLAKIKVGNGLEEAFRWVPCSPKDKKERVVATLKGLAEGAKLVLDGEDPT